jgi:hypothetical protein
MVHLILNEGTTKTGLFLGEETSPSRGVTHIEDQHLIPTMTDQSVVMIRQGDRTPESMTMALIHTRHIVTLRTEIHLLWDTGHRRHLRHYRIILHLDTSQHTTVETGSNMSFHPKLLLPSPMLSSESLTGLAITVPCLERSTPTMSLGTTEAVETPGIGHPQSSRARIMDVQALGPSSSLRDMLIASEKGPSFDVSRKWPISDTSAREIAEPMRA